jgi:hypothetical protein
VFIRGLCGEKGQGNECEKRKFFHDIRLPFLNSWFYFCGLGLTDPRARITGRQRCIVLIGRFCGEKGERDECEKRKFFHDIRLPFLRFW